MFSSTPLANSGDDNAVLGLSIEPLQEIQSQLASIPSATVKSVVADPTRDPTILAERIAKHLFNYISGFVGGGGGVTPELAVPMSVVAKWYETFMGKVRAGGTGFLERGD